MPTSSWGSTRSRLVGGRSLASDGATMRLYAGTFLIALATLALEITLTRLLSLTTWYHLAFFALSTAMLGMTAGAVRVYLRPDRFTTERWAGEAAGASLGFALIVPCALALLCLIPAGITLTLMGIVSLLATTVVCSAPFYFFGIAITLALTRSRLPVGRIYGADLVGAALGCLFVLGGLELRGAPSVILWCAALGSVAAVCYGTTRSRRFRVAAALLAVLLAAAGTANTYGRWGVYPVVRKGIVEMPAGVSKIVDATSGFWQVVELEKWNALSRVSVSPEHMAPPALWGPSPKLPPSSCRNASSTSTVARARRCGASRPRPTSNTCATTSSNVPYLPAADRRRRDHRSRRRQGRAVRDPVRPRPRHRDRRQPGDHRVARERVPRVRRPRRPPRCRAGDRRRTELADPHRPALRADPDVVDRQLGGDAGRSVHALRERALHGRGVERVPQPARQGRSVHGLTLLQPGESRRDRPHAEPRHRGALAQRCRRPGGTARDGRESEHGHLDAQQPAVHRRRHRRAEAGVHRARVRAGGRAGHALRTRGPAGDRRRAIAPGAAEGDRQQAVELRPADRREPVFLQPAPAGSSRRGVRVPTTACSPATRWRRSC